MTIPVQWLTASIFVHFLIFHEECAAVITMEHKLAYTEAKALCYWAKIDDPFPFYRHFDDTYQICIWCQCLVDWVFRNCGVRNPLLYLNTVFSSLSLTLPSSLFCCFIRRHSSAVCFHDPALFKEGHSAGTPWCGPQTSKTPVPLTRQIRRRYQIHGELPTPLSMVQGYISWE